MPSIFGPNWLSRRPLEIALRQFIAMLPAYAKVLYIDCGQKPCAKMLIVAFTFADWSGRFLLHILPIVLLFAAIGFVQNYGQVLDAKLPLSK